MKGVQLFYTALETALQAGLGLDRSLRAAVDDGLGPLADAAEQIIAEIHQGRTLAQAMGQHPHLFPAADLALIDFGEETGTLEAVFANLTQWYEFKRRNWQTVLSGMIHPTVVIHAAALIIPAPQALLGQITFTVYGFYVLLILACFYLPVGGAALAYRKFIAQPDGRLHVDEWLLKVPVLGVALRDLALSRYCRNFMTMLVAGANADRCNAAAVKMCGNAAVAAWFEPGTQCARDGHEVTTGFSQQVPHDFMTLWQTAEQSGRLDDSLKRLADNYGESAEARIKQIALWLPRLIYACVAVFLIVTIMRLAFNVLGAYQG
jgi:general secretion pathway protein F